MLKRGRSVEGRFEVVTGRGARRSEVKSKRRAIPKSEINANQSNAMRETPPLDSSVNRCGLPFTSKNDKGLPACCSLLSETERS